MDYFGLDSYSLGFSPELEPFAQMANGIEEWARREINSQGLEDTVDTFDFLIQSKMSEMGISSQTNKLRLLERLTQQIAKARPKDDSRDKIKKITENLLADAEKSKERSRAIYKSQARKLEKELEDARRIIRKQERALKTATPKGK